MHTTKALITGGAGFIGSHLVDRCIDSGFETTVLDFSEENARKNLDHCWGQFQFLKGSVDDINELVPDLESYDVVFHLGGNAKVHSSVEDPLFDFGSLQATIGLLDEIRKLEKRPAFIFASSGAVYGNPEKFPIEECDPVNPESPYGVSKLAGERYVYVYCQRYGIKAASLRLISVYGPRQRKQVVYDLTQKLLNNPHQLSVMGDGTQERDFVYVQDVVEAFLRVYQHGELKGESYNVGSGTHSSIKQLVEAICGASQFNPRIEFTGSIRSGDVEKWRIDISKLRSIGYEAKTSLADGLQNTFQWCIRQQFDSPVAEPVVENKKPS